MIEARIIADSINPSGKRITTFITKSHRYILAEINTHRALSRNSASSRARPSEKVIQDVLDNPAVPVYWGMNQRGMQATTEIDVAKQTVAKSEWLSAREDAVKHVKKLMELGVHKQVANRLLEPFMYQTALITATEWGNFFNLRAHPDAQPEFQELAFKMLEVYVDSVPANKDWGEWHVPFGDQYLAEGLSIEQQLKIATARAARVSYVNFEGNIDHQKDYELHDTLVTSGHCSPLEHAAMANPGRTKSGNFSGWEQYRKTIPGENRSEFNPRELLEKRVKRNETT